MLSIPLASSVGPGTKDSVVPGHLTKLSLAPFSPGLFKYCLWIGLEGTFVNTRTVKQAL